MRLRRLAGVLLVLVLSACASSRAEDDTAVRAVMSSFMEALNALDTEGMSGHFADDMTAFFPVAKAERLDGKAAIVDVFRTYVDETKKRVSRTNIVPEDLRVDLRGDVAVVSFYVHNPAAVSRRTFVWERRGDHWLITHMHASNYAIAK